MTHFFVDGFADWMVPDRIQQSTGAGAEAPMPRIHSVLEGLNSSLAKSNAREEELRAKAVMP